MKTIFKNKLTLLLLGILSIVIFTSMNNTPDEITFTSKIWNNHLYVIAKRGAYFTMTHDESCSNSNHKRK